MAHRVFGDRGPWVLLLHGIGGGQAIWDEHHSGTAPAIAAAGFRAVAIDLPGYGASAVLPPGGLPDMADHLLQLVEALGASPVLLLGHSMGGMLAQEFVAQHPSRVAGLVLACTSASFGPPGGDWQARFVAERLAPLDAGLGMAGMAAALVPPMLGPAASAEASALAQAVMARVPEATYRAVLQAIVRFDRREGLARIAVPSLLLAGSHDPTAPAALMQRMAQRLGSAAGRKTVSAARARADGDAGPDAAVEFVTLAGAGHIANVEQPAAFNAAVVSFLQRHFAPAADSALPGGRSPTTP